MTSNALVAGLWATTGMKPSCPRCAATLQRPEETIGQARHKATDEPRPRCAAALGAGSAYIMGITRIQPGATVNRPLVFPAIPTALTPLETAVEKMP